MTCCFPGCNRPAEYADLDHTVAYEINRLTHPGNLKCLCRKHHLLEPLSWQASSHAATNPYGDATAKSRHTPGTPLSA
jgi:hypothetical protein